MSTATPPRTTVALVLDSSTDQVAETSRVLREVSERDELVLVSPGLPAEVHALVRRLSRPLRSVVSTDATSPAAALEVAAEVASGQVLELRSASLPQEVLCRTTPADVRSRGAHAVLAAAAPVPRVVPPGPSSLLGRPGAEASQQQRPVAGATFVVDCRPAPADAASTVLSVLSFAAEDPQLDAELVLVSPDRHLLDQLTAPLKGDVRTAASLTDVEPLRRTVITLRAGEAVDGPAVVRRLAEVAEPFLAVLVCDDDAQAAARTVVSLAEAVQDHPSHDVHLVLVSRGGRAARELLPALGGDVHVVDVTPGTGDAEAFAAGADTVAAIRRALLLAGQEVDPAALASLLSTGGAAAAPVGRQQPSAHAVDRSADPSTTDETRSAPSEGATSARVTVVIPVHDKAHLTRACLESVERTQHLLSTPFEVVVVDNASTDSTPELLHSLGGDVRVVRNEENLGFGEACNQGAHLARGDYVLFLNNDTEVQGRWLDVLVEAMDEDPRRGAVQPKLLYPDGRLNDAGGLVFRGGEAAVYGKGSPHPDAPAYDVRRAPDYASGACLLVRRSAFEQVGGFDSRYAPAYYEDTDLSFELRQAGWTLLYEPAAVVVHVEGGTAGTDETKGFKAFQPRNKLTFAQKWAADLAQRPVLDPAAFDAWAHRPQGGLGPGEGPGAVQDGLRVLVLDPFPPMFDRASGCLRTFEIEKALRALGHSVVHEALQAAPERARYARELSRYGIRLHGLDPAEPLVVDAAGTAVMRPPHSPDAYDVIVVGPWEPAEALLPALRQHFPRARVVVDSCDLHFVREERMAGGPTPELARRRARELATYAAADVVLVVSEVEAQVLAAEITTPTAVVGNAHTAVAAPAPLSGRDGVVFVGNTQHSPNTDAARWLVQEVWPSVASRVPGARLRLVGNDPAGVYRSLAGPSVEAVGWVPETGPLLDASRVSVAPLRAGAGVKGKVGEALSRGLPVVTTSVGAEGLGLRHGLDALVADSAAALADELVRVLLDDCLWADLSAAGLAHSARALGPDRMRADLASLLSSPAQAPTRLHPTHLLTGAVR